MSDKIPRKDVANILENCVLIVKLCNVNTEKLRSDSLFKLQQYYNYSIFV